MCLISWFFHSAKTKRVQMRLPWRGGRERSNVQIKRHLESAVFRRVMIDARYPADLITLGRIVAIIAFLWNLNRDSGWIG